MSIQAMKQAVDYLRLARDYGIALGIGNTSIADAINDLLAAIEAVEKQEPVAYVDALTCSINFCGKDRTLLPSGTKLYTHPQPAIPEDWQHPSRRK